LPRHDNKSKYGFLVDKKGKMVEGFLVDNGVFLLKSNIHPYKTYMKEFGKIRKWREVFSLSPLLIY